MSRLLPRALTAVALSALLVGAGCGSGSGSGSGGSGGTLDAETLIARWPDRPDGLDLTPQPAQFVAAVRAAVPAATDVAVRSLTGDGGGVPYMLGFDASLLPDVVFLSGGTVASTDTAVLRRAVLRALLGISGDQAAAGTGFDSTLDRRPFTGPHGLHGGYVNHGAHRLSGFVAVPDDTWCAFVAHGVAVVVLGAAFTRAQDEALAAALRK